MVEGIYAINDIPVTKLIDELEIVARAKGQRKKKNEKDLLDIVTAFDIETTTKWIYEGVNQGDRKLIMRRPHSFMYIWQFQLGSSITVIGRTWNEFTALQKVLYQIQEGVREKLKLSSKPLFVCFVHNLAYEWQYLQGEYKFLNENVFFREVRKPLYARLNSLLEFRCSYMHSNRSLESFGEVMGCSVHKLSGAEFNYEKIRYPWTELTDYEMEYCVNDVRVLEEAIRREMERDGDTLLTLPLTSTGYPRRDAKEALKPLRYSISKILPDLDVYKLLRRCFRGGDTHANRYHVGKILKNVHSYDIASSYPARQMLELFPMGPFLRIKEDEQTLETVCKQINIGRAVIADYVFYGLRLKDPYNPDPYISTGNVQSLNEYVDNGRIMSADMVKVALTEIDLMIILDEYDFLKVKVFNAYSAFKGPLPQAYKDVIMRYYTQKTALKGVEGEEYNYTKNKNLVNAIFGMSVQDPINDIIFYDAELEDHYIVSAKDEEQAAKELERAAFPYQWGVYTTAYARKALRDGIKAVGKDKDGISRLVYCDTDCIKYLGTIQMAGLNRVIEGRALKAGAVASDRKGVAHPIGVWEREKDYEYFITQGAKRYAYIQDGKIGVTVSGVSKAKDDSGISIAAKELKSLKRFRPGMRWSEAGGTASVYNDHDDFTITDKVTGKSVHVGPNVSIVPTTYTMSFPYEYERLLRDIAEADLMKKKKGRDFYL